MKSQLITCGRTELDHCQPSSAAGNPHYAIRNPQFLVLVLAALLCVLGCSKSASQSSAPHPRIVSYSPAMTDMLFEMGLGDHVVGITSQCNLPPGQQRTVVGDALSARSSAEAMAAVEPDIVLVQQNIENFAALKRIRPSVQIEHFNIETIADIAAALERIGSLAGNKQAGLAARDEFLRKLDAVRSSVAGLEKPRTMFVIGYDRPSTGGKSSFLHEMIEIAGGLDCAEKYPRWSQLNAEAVLAMSPQVLVCWTDPGTEDKAKEYWAGFAAMPAAQNGRIFAVSSRAWTIPSTRIADLTAELAKMIHEDIRDAACR